jgi:hypothetical protein
VNLIKAFIGLFIALFYFIPKLMYLKLLIAYHIFFYNEENLTANPKEHIKRAKKLLKGGKNNLLLYAALELRFALERSVHNELVFSEKASNNILDMYDPSKKRKFMSIIDDNVNYAHKIYFINKKTKEKVYWGIYKPLPQEKVNYIKGRLGDLLHAKEGLLLGVSDDNWYVQTRNFLYESLDFLEKHFKNNEKYFIYADSDKYELVKVSNDKVN